MNEAWLADLAERFWTAAGGPPRPPRDIQAAVSLVLPVTVVFLPMLGLERIEAWLERRSIPYRFESGNRRLRGCLVASGGHGIIFVDGAEPEDERRFTIAHEVAHFLLDYHEPRERALRAIGPGVLDVLDGRREPTPEERVHSALTGCPLGVHAHLMERSGDAGARAAAVEYRADRLAWELLAPASELRRIDDARLEAVLRDRYGLPRGEAERYARELSRSRRPRTYLEWLSAP
ncbi:MAG TPA: ImmA/IrrE family metallo-endopeptidase [Thermomicrobiales bacterium]